MSESRGVIHDIGYRGYTGTREGIDRLALALYTAGLRHAYGLGRSGRSKVLPFILLGIQLLPAVIMVGVLTLLPFDRQVMSYASYTSRLQMVISLFAAAQAPALFSRDLRHRSIVLYLARPLSATVFALVRWASLTTAILIFTLLPTTVLFLGGLLAGLDFGDEAPDYAKSVVLQLLLAMMLAGITGFISSVALRRGFAVVTSIVVLIVGVGIVLIIQGIADAQSIDHVGEIAGLFSPWTLHNGLGAAWDAGVSSLADPEGAWSILYLLAMVAISLGSVALIVRRFMRVGAR